MFALSWFTKSRCFVFPIQRKFSSSPRAAVLTIIHSFVSTPEGSISFVLRRRCFCQDGFLVYGEGHGLGPRLDAAPCGAGEGPRFLLQEPRPHMFGEPSFPIPWLRLGVGGQLWSSQCDLPLEPFQSSRHDRQCQHPLAIVDQLCGRQSHQHHPDTSLLHQRLPGARLQVRRSIWLLRLQVWHEPHAEQWNCEPSDHSKPAR